MKLPVVIQHNPTGEKIIPPEGWDQRLKKYDPSSAFDDSTLPENNISKERIKEIDKLAESHLSEALKKMSENLKPGKEIPNYPDSWKHKAPAYSGFIDGLMISIQADGDTIQEVINKLRIQCQDLPDKIMNESKNNWTSENITFHEIEI